MRSRLLIWSLYDSKTSLDELRHAPPGAAGRATAGSRTTSQERLGLFTLGDELPDLGEVPALIGKEPEVAEEFDVE